MRRRSRLIWAVYLAFVVAAGVALAGGHEGATRGVDGSRVLRLSAGGSISIPEPTPNSGALARRAECAKLGRELRQKYPAKPGWSEDSWCAVEH